MPGTMTLSQLFEAPNLLFALLVCTGFCLLLFLGSKFLPGTPAQGARLPNGVTPSYTLNGFLMMILTLAGVSLLSMSTSWFSLAVIPRLFWQFFIAANVIAFVLTLVLYLQAKSRSSNIVKDLWYGADYNPTWWGVDLKLYAYRPSLIGLGLINLGFAAFQYQRYGHITLAMGLYQGMTLFYLLSTFQYEHGLLSMWDMIEEKFGFMLIWGDLVLVPFFYCIPAYFLVDYHEPLSPWLAAGLVGVYVLGFWMFRGTNAQKNRFKRNPNAPIWGKRPEAIDGRLLVSGFWGLGRKLNYSGEILIYLSWTAMNRLNSPWPYLLPLWLACLLIHRAWRDDKRCSQKYGELWDRYCQRVKFRMIPFIY